MLRFFHCLIAYLLICSNCFAQDFKLLYDQATGEITQTKIVQTGKPKDVSFAAIRAWMAQKFPNYKAGVQVEDAASGQIIYKGVEPNPLGRVAAFSYTVTIDVKDDKYRCVINNVEKSYRSSPGFTTTSVDIAMENSYRSQVHKLDSIIATTKKKRELNQLHQDREIKQSILKDYEDSHYYMALHFSVIQGGIRDSVVKLSQVKPKSDF